MPYLPKKPLPKLSLCSRLQWSSLAVSVETNTPTGHFLFGLCPDNVGGEYILSALSATNGIQKSLKVARVNASGSVTLRVAVDTQAGGLGTWYEGAIAAASNQGFFVAWRKEQLGVRLVRYDATGNASWTTILGSTSNHLQFPTVVPDGAGGAFVSYIESTGSGASLKRELMAARVDNTGATVWQSAAATLASGLVTQPRGAPVLIATQLKTALVLWQELPSTGQTANPIIGRWLAGTGFGNTTLVVGSTAETWFESPTASRRAVAAANGDAFVGYSDATGNLQIARYPINSVAPTTTWSVGSLMHPSYFSLGSDGANGVLAVAVDASGAVNAYHYNAQGSDQWTGFGSGLTTLANPPATNAPRFQHNSLCGIFLRNTTEAIVIVSQGSTAATPRHLEMSCLRSDGTLQQPRATTVFGNVGTGTESTWLGEPLGTNSLGVVVSKDMALFTQSLGCCPDEPSSEENPPRLPDLFCPILPWYPDLGRGWVELRLPCGLRPRGSIGVLPFGQLIDLTPVGLPGGTYLPHVKTPDWVRITFQHAPADLEVDIYLDGNKRIAQAEAVSKFPEELLGRYGRTLVATFRPAAGRTHYLVFRSGSPVDGREKISLQISAEYGPGEPPALVPGKGTPKPKAKRAT